MPVLGAENPTHVDFIEQHRRLRGVHLHCTAIVGDPRGPKSATLKSLVIENESAAIPKQDITAVSLTSQKHEQVTGEQIHPPLPLNNGAQPVVVTAQIDRLHREVDPNAARQRQHLPSALRTATTYAGSQPSRKLTRTEPNSASTDAAETPRPRAPATHVLSAPSSSPRPSICIGGI